MSPRRLEMDALISWKKPLLGSFDERLIGLHHRHQTCPHLHAIGRTGVLGTGVLHW